MSAVLTTRTFQTPRSRIIVIMPTRGARQWVWSLCSEVLESDILLGRQLLQSVLVRYRVNFPLKCHVWISNSKLLKRYLWFHLVSISTNYSLWKYVLLSIFYLFAFSHHLRPISSMKSTFVCITFLVARNPNGLVTTEIISAHPRFRKEINRSIGVLEIYES